MVTLDQAGLNHTAVVMLAVPPSLQSVVELFWIDERPRLALHSPQWRVVADDAPHLIYYRYLDDDARAERHRLNVVRDCRALLGESPSQFFARAS